MGGRIILAILLMQLGMPDQLSAHEDLPGEVHPQFYEREGKLWVKFSELNPDGTRKGRWHAPVKEAGYVEDRKEGWPGVTEENSWMRGHHAVADETLFTVVGGKRASPGITRQKEGIKLVALPLEYDGYQWWMTDSMLVLKKEIVLLGTACFYKEGNALNRQLGVSSDFLPNYIQVLWRVDRTTGKTLSIVEAGVPERTIFLAVTSGLQNDGEYVYFAWVGPERIVEKKKDGRVTYRDSLWLSRVNLKTQVHERRILQSTWPNTAIDLAVHGEKVWIAWHHFTGEYRARIKITSVGLDDEKDWQEVPHNWPPKLEWTSYEEQRKADDAASAEEKLEREKDEAKP